MPWGRQTITALLIGWIALAAPAAAPEIAPAPLPSLQSLRVEPGQIQLHGSNRQQQLLITGLSKSGQAIDVTRLCEIVSSDPSVIAARGSRVQGVGDGAAIVRIRLGGLSAA